MKPGVQTKYANRLKVLAIAVRKLPDRHVLVGIPADHAERDGEITNAQLGYIHEFGAPEANVPARPSLVPGIREAQGRIGAQLKGSAVATLKGDMAKAERHLHAAGLIAVNSVRAYISKGVPPPLADSTLENRARRRKGSGHRIGKGAVAELKARAAGAPPSTTAAKPLIDSGQFRAAITYVIRDAK